MTAPAGGPARPTGAVSPAPLIVLGSVNRDYVVVVERHPLPGETLLGSALASGMGGKGANQAAAAARGKARPVLIAAVGDDAVGRELLEELVASGVDVSRVGVSSDQPTGVALITVAADGENTIVVASGANATLDPGETSALLAELAGPGSVLLSQLEIPLETVRGAALAVVDRGGRFVLNLSPYRGVGAELLSLADPLILNETEAAALLGRGLESTADAEAAAVELLALSRSVVITLGGDGVVAADAEGVTLLPARRVPVVDTTGAGDAFAGALAASLATGSRLDEAVHAGIQAGSIAVQYLGAQQPPGFVGV